MLFTVQIIAEISGSDELHTDVVTVESSSSRDAIPVAAEISSENVPGFSLLTAHSAPAA